MSTPGKKKIHKTKAVKETNCEAQDWLFMLNLSHYFYYFLKIIIILELNTGLRTAREKTKISEVLKQL